MNKESFLQLLEGLWTSLQLTGMALVLGCFLALFMTIVLVIRLPVIHWFCRGLITLFTGTPLLVQFILIYSGPAQFEWVRESIFWDWLVEPWFCAVLALALNTAAYSTLLFKGAFEAIPQGQWQACRALGMNTTSTLSVLMPYALRRSIPAYSNEVILVFKGTSVVSVVTIMDLMGYTIRIYMQTYDAIMVFGMAGALYLAVNGILTLIFRVLEKKLLAFENGHT